MKDPAEMDMGVWFNMRFAYRRGVTVEEISTRFGYSVEDVAHHLDDLIEEERR